MVHRLILWDIDGTLLSAGSAGRAALERGAAAASGLEEVPGVTMGGKTDPQIIREILTAAGVPQPDIDRMLPLALETAERALAAETGRMRSEGRVHPGVPRLLDALAATEGVRQSLLTGNIAANAVVKVRAFGLEEYFDVEIGAYGTDHADRIELVPIALRRARELRGEAYRRDEVWIIGDTANDLRCATEAGVRCLIVGTGPAGPDAVRSLPADAVLDDLAETAHVLQLLLD